MLDFLKSLPAKFLKLTIVGAVAAGVIFSGNIKDAYYRNEVGDNVVRMLSATGGGGTGFHVKAPSGAVYILTNKHVCEVADKDDNIIVEYQGQEIKRKVIERYAQHDLCLVEALPDHEDGVDVASWVGTGEDVIVVGHPGLRKLTLSHGEYIGKETIDMPNFKIETKEDCRGIFIEDIMVLIMVGHGVCLEPVQASAMSNSIYPGNSGSPVVNKYGNLVGVAFAGNPQQSTDSYMVPLIYVKDFLKDF